MTPFFSIIVATYNVETMLSGLLESLCSQTYPNFEVVLQDGASKDETMAVAERFRDRLPALSLNSGPDCGIYDAWNKALPFVRGEWLVFLGADDVLYAPDVLAQAKDAILSAVSDGKDLLFAAGGVVVATSTGTPLRYISGRTEGAAASLRAAEIPTPFPGLFLHRTVFADGGFDACLRIAGDFELLCRTWKDDHRALQLPFLITIMREGGISTNPRFAALGCKETLDAAEKYFQSGWTGARRKHYMRTRVLSALYSLFPKHGRIIHNALRRLRGKPALADRNASSFPFSPEDVPVFITSFNRLACLKKLVAWLEKNKLADIIIVDNNSTYPPLLAYLDSLSHRVIRLEENLGHLAVWKCGLFEDILSKGYFIVTDPDVLPDEECPGDAVMQFYTRLMEYPQITKCGFSLRIDDIPEGYPLRESVLAVEGPYWQQSLPDGSGYFAPIDTTFALYRPGIAADSPKWLEGVRLAPPYAARHLPWYESADTDDEESIFYRQAIQTQSTFWTAADADSLKKENLALRVRIHELEHQIEMLSQNFGNQLTILTYKILRNVKNTLWGKR